MPADLISQGSFVDRLRSAHAVSSPSAARSPARIADSTPTRGPPGAATAKTAAAQSTLGMSMVNSAMTLAMIVAVNNGNGSQGGNPSNQVGPPPSYQSATPSYGQSAPYDSGPPPSAPAVLPSYAVPVGSVYYSAPVAPAPVLSVSVGWSQFSAQRGPYVGGWRAGVYGYSGGPRYASGWRVSAGSSNGGSSWHASVGVHSSTPYGYGGASAGWSAPRAAPYPMRQATGYGYRSSMTASRGYAHASYGSVARR